MTPVLVHCFLCRFRDGENTESHFAGEEEERQGDWETNFAVEEHEEGCTVTGSFGVLVPLVPDLKSYG